MVDDRNCSNCGGGDWEEIWENTYPDSRNERDRTVKTVYVCNTCGSEGRHFVHRAGGPDTYSGALRQ